MTKMVSLNDRMLEFAKQQLATYGGLDGGLYNYYTERISKGRMLAEYEEYLVSYLKEINLPLNSIIVEPAAGIATLSFAIFDAGYRNITAIEHDHRRYAAAEALKQHLGYDVKISNNSFPHLSINKIDFIVMTNARASSNSYSALIYYLKTVNLPTIMMPRLWEVGVDTFDDGCRILDSEGVQYNKLKYELVHIVGY